MTSELTASFERKLVANLGVRVGDVFRYRKDYYSAVKETINATVPH